MGDISQAVAIAQRAEHPVVIYGPRITEKAIEELKLLNHRATYIALEPGANTRGAEVLGFRNGFNPSGVKFLYAALGEQKWTDQDLLGQLDRKTFVAVQASFVSSLTERADLVLPVAIWSERSGSLTNSEGRILQLSRAVDPSGDAKPDWEIISLLADRLGKKLGSSLDEVSSSAALAINERRNRHGQN